MPEYRDIGIPECRDIGISEFRDIGRPEYRDFGIVGWQNKGIMAYRDIGILEFLDIGKKKKKGDFASLFLDGAGAALGEFAAEALFDEVLEAVLEGFDADAVDDVAHEGEHQQEACFGFGNASGAHVE